VDPEPANGWTRIADFVLRARRLGLAFVVLGLVGVAVLPLLRFDFSPQTLFDRTSERAKTWERYRAEYGADDHMLMLLVEGDLRRAQTWAALEEIEARVAAEVPEISWSHSLLSLPVPRSPEPGVVQVEPLAQGPPASDAEAAALTTLAVGHPLLTGTLISADGRLACLLLKADDDVHKLAEVKPFIEQLRAIAADASRDRDDISTWLLGPHAYRTTVVSVMVREELRFVPLTACVLALVLLLLYRSGAGVLIPLLSVGLGALWTLGAMALSGQNINIINTITATLVLVIGVADAIHMMTRYGQERREGHDRRQAMRRALTHVGAACLLTSVTTAVGFLTLLSAHLPILRSFGLYAAIGVMLTFGFTIVFVPWALVRSPKDPVVRDPSESIERGERRTPLGRFLSAHADGVQRHPKLVVVLGLLLAAGFALGIRGATVDNFIMEYVPRDDPILDAHHLLEEKLAGVVYVDVLLEAQSDGESPWHDPELLRRASTAETTLRADPGVQATMSVLGLLRELRWVQRGGPASGELRDALPASRAEAASLLLLAEMSGAETTLQSHLDPGRRVLRMTARTADLGARAYLQLEGRMERVLADAFAGADPPVQVTITGTSQVGYGGIASLVRDLLTSLAWAFGLIFLTLAVLFRSIKLAALAMLPNVLPIVVVLGSMGWLGLHLETLSAMVFSIGLGIAVDDTIHYLARYCAEVRAGHSPEEAVRRTTERTGRAIVYTSLVLLMGFGVLYTSAFPPNRSFAVLAGGVIATALAADLWLLPALLLVFRPKVPGAPAPLTGARQAGTIGR
jgi:uncharacterized protein